MKFNELIKAVDEALPQEVSCPRLEKTMLNTYIVQLLESNSQTTTSYLTTNFTTKLSESPWARSHHPKYVTYGYIKSWNSCRKTPPHKNKISTRARFRDDGYMTWEKAPARDVADFFQTANNFHNLLRFTSTTSPQEITFLDTTVYKGTRFRLKRTR